MDKNFRTKISNILVIGSDGAGLRAAIEGAKSGLAVQVLGKRPKNDSHTSLAAGGINAALANVDKSDSWQQHFADTYLEGYGIGNQKCIEILAKEAPSVVEEIDLWGANFDRTKDNLIDQRFFGAHTYRRTCYSGDSTGKAILRALLKKADEYNIPIEDSQYVSEILVNNNICFGAFAFNLNNGEKTLYLSDTTIIATGGYTKIWKRSSSRKDENNGDGIYLGLKAGCTLIDMEMIQFHPTGMLSPEEVSGTLVTEAVRGEGGRLFNNLNQRFMDNYDEKRMELSSRDKIAIANYTEIISGRGTPNGGVYLDLTHIEKEKIIKKLPSIYKQFIEYQMLDISKEKMEVSPTAHYSMGGLLVSPEDHSTGINGLYACGEVAGGVHGANRLGGNSLAEILVFGKLVGKSAVTYSQKLSNHERSSFKVEVANEKIISSIQNGEEIGRQLENEIQTLMWEKCGVIRDKDNLLEALSELEEIKKRYKRIDVRVKSDDYSDLAIALNVEAGLIAAEATILSALAREESIGAHQRKDFPKKKIISM